MSRLRDYLWFCGLFDLVPKILQNSKLWAPLLKTSSHDGGTGVGFMLYGAVRSMQSEFELEGCRLCFVKEIALHWNLQQFGTTIPVHIAEMSTQTFSKRTYDITSGV